MDRRKKTLLTIVIGGCLFVAWRTFVLVNRVVPASASAGTALQQNGSGPEGASVPQSKAASEDMASRASAQQAVESQSWGRDPFDPSPFDIQQAATQAPVETQTSKPPPAPSLMLSGVSRAGGRWLAAVNGGIVGVGDVIQEKYKVVKISKSSITLVSGGWAFFIELGAKEADIRPWTEEP